MDETNGRALKEWAAIEQVLAAGDLALLLRKGGLWERRDGFEMEHRSFWLFPTLFHQNPEELRPEFSWALDSARAAHLGPDHVRLEHFAEVTEAYRIEKLDTVRRFAHLQALTEASIESRFHYRNKPYLHLLLLRVHRIATPHVIPNTLGYEGCVSWVELDESLPTEGAIPVIDDDRFAALREAVTADLDAAEGAIRA